MTVFGMGYRRLEYRPTSTLRRWLAIAFGELRAPFRTRLQTILFLICQSPGFGALALLFIWSGFWQIGPARSPRMGAMGQADPSTPDFYLVCMTSPGAFLMVTTLVAFTISRAIARDRASQGLEILWTRGVTPFGYFVGKVLGAVFVLGIGAVLVPFVLWLLALATAEDPRFFATTIAFVPRLLLAGFVQTVLVAGLATAVSSLARTPNGASILWVLFVAGGGALAGVFTGLLRADPGFRALSPWLAITRVTEAIAGVTPRFEFPLTVALSALAVLASLATVIVARRLRLVEAVG